MDDPETPLENERKGKKKRKRNAIHNQERHIRQRENRLMQRLNIQLNQSPSTDFSNPNSLAMSSQTTDHLRQSSLNDEDQSVEFDQVDRNKNIDYERPGHHRYQASLTTMHENTFATHSRQQNIGRPMRDRRDEESATHRGYSSYGQQVATSEAPPYRPHSDTYMKPGCSDAHSYSHSLPRLYLTTNLYEEDPAQNSGLQWNEHEALYDERYGEPIATDDYSPMPSPRSQHGDG